ncbi:MAG: hypothetical protein RBU24_13575 [Kiritimatiellia bacterium]|jgi:hypothetical protein|nr:hypothetical protein [Kiritimatiellia bacterium]
MNQAAEILDPEVLPMTGTPGGPTALPSAALQILKETGVEQSTATQLRFAFNEMFGQAERWMSQAQAIRVTDVSQVREMKMAREVRLALRQIRCDAENTRKRLKSDALAKGKAIDGIANVLKALIEPAEKHLQEQEDFAKRVEEQRIAALNETRRLALSAYMDVSGLSENLAGLSQEQFDAMLYGAQQKRVREAEAAAEAERLRLAEAERARKDAEALEEKRKAELAEARKRAAAEARARIEAERKADLERMERARIENELAQQRAIARAEKAEADRQAAEREAAARRAAQAPDREKVLAFAASVRRLAVPALTSPAGVKAQADLAAKTEGFARWIEGAVAANL